MIHSNKIRVTPNELELIKLLRRTNFHYRLAEHSLHSYKLDVKRQIQSKERAIMNQGDLIANGNLSKEGYINDYKLAKMKLEVMEFELIDLEGELDFYTEYTKIMLAIAEEKYEIDTTKDFDYKYENHYVDCSLLIWNERNNY